MGQARDPVQRPRGRPPRWTRSAQYLKNDKYVNGGLGDVKSIATHHVPGRRPADPRGHLLAAPPGELLRGQLARGHQGGRGRRRLRVLPARARTPDAKPVLGGGEFVDGVRRPARGQGVPDLPVAATPGPTPRPSSGGSGWVSANKGLEARATLSAARSTSCRSTILQDPNAVFRFDGSDLMPAASAPTRSGSRPRAGSPVRTPSRRWTTSKRPGRSRSDRRWAGRDGRRSPAPTRPASPLPQEVRVTCSRRDHR